MSALPPKADIKDQGGGERLAGHTPSLRRPRFEQINCASTNDYGSGGSMQVVLRYPTVTCPGCKRPMTPSPPLAVSDDTELCDLVYTCEACGATTTRTIKIEK
jgi:RNase P subunit RPR2